MERAAESGEQRSAASDAQLWLEDYLTMNGGVAESAKIKRAADTAGHTVRSIRTAVIPSSSAPAPSSRNATLSKPPTMPSVDVSNGCMIPNSTNAEPTSNKLFPQRHDQGPHDCAGSTTSPLPRSPRGTPPTRSSRRRAIPSSIPRQRSVDSRSALARPCGERELCHNVQRAEDRYSTQRPTAPPQRQPVEATPTPASQPGR
jgi:hypothetical protein